MAFMRMTHVSFLRLLCLDFHHEAFKKRSDREAARGCIPSWLLLSIDFGTMLAGYAQSGSALRGTEARDRATTTLRAIPLGVRSNRFQDLFYDHQVWYYLNIQVIRDANRRSSLYSLATQVRSLPD